MRKLFLLFALLPALVMNASALDLSAPPVPEESARWMPGDTSDFPGAVSQLLQGAISALGPEVSAAGETALTAAGIVLIFSVLDNFPGTTGKPAAVAGTAALAAALLKNAESLIRLASDTIVRLSEYGKLLLPVMTAALAGQGGTAASAALYAGTAAFDLLLTNLISGILVPAVYFFLAMAAATSALGDDGLKRLRDLIKWFIGWSLKILLTVFTTYMSISGVVSGATDAVTLKAAKFTISSAIPVVGGILSDASEAILVSAALVKNAAGIYGIFALLAVFLVPFLKIAVQYLVLKLTGGLCGLFGSKAMTELIEDFSTAMGFLLAMTASVCLLLLISTICFLKGVG